MFWKSAPKSNDTVINEKSFRLTLPGVWSAGPTDKPNLRTYKTEAEQLTVSIYGSIFEDPGKMSHDEKEAVFRQWVSKRRDVENKIANPNDLTLGSPSFGESNGRLAARYSGLDAARKRHFYCLILASSSAFEIFYYEASGKGQSFAEDRAKAIFNSVEIPQ